jgi:hypothetical protein
MFISTLKVATHLGAVVLLVKCFTVSTKGHRLRVRWST